MRKISANKIIPAVKKLCIEANLYLPDDVLSALKKASRQENTPQGKEILNQILENSKVAAREKIPLCQDTGLGVIFVEFGQELIVVDGDFYQALQEGVRQGYQAGYLRKSVVKDPLSRENSQDNTPAIIHAEVVPGDKLKITFMPKGGGAENMSAFANLLPQAGEEGVIDFVIQTVQQAGARACPPLIVGVGIGGNFEQSTLLAKKSLLRSLSARNKNRRYALLEQKILKKINSLGIGPQGLGGRITALAVLIATAPCHISSLPVAVNIQCHSCRHKSVVL
ncbi:MAG: fumarate hydratase [Elusimicrobiota bacterium]